METDLDLYLGVHLCELCPLHKLHGWNRRVQQVREDGEPVGQAVPAYPGRNYEAGGLAVMAEAPGWVENIRGRPLQGPAGDQFNKLLAAAGIDRESLLLLNMVRHQPPNNRLRDFPEAVANCGYWTAAELRHYNPAVVVLMGATAISSMFGKAAKVGRTRGMWTARGDQHEWGARLYTATYHPQAVSYDGGLKGELGQLVVRDLREARARWYDPAGVMR